MADNAQNEGAEKKHDKNEFKKPVLIGRIGRLPKKALTGNDITEKTTEEKKIIKTTEESRETSSSNTLPPAVLLKELSTPIPYKEPKWSGLCPDGSDYGLEVLKSGMIVEKVDLTNKPYYVFGRLANCDVIMAHPTISRYHAVIQYKAFAEEGEHSSGWYLYDLGSTHGSFLNRERLKPNHYTRVRVGHQIKFGNSSRTYIVLGPDFDCEGESELTVTEIKKRAVEMKAEKDRIVKELVDHRERERLQEEKKKEEQGIDWGMGEDADEEQDLADNPYAVAANEELYLDDPKKTLRGYFEREGHELIYNCEERGVGQFMCRVELPMDDARGRPVVAEVIHRGKKKDAVVQCALEACRVLDRAGLLRQATHESRRRKQRDWGADDYYDSDEDTFLDRTGSVERKRKMRMQKLGVAEMEKSQKALTYDDLTKQIKEIEEKIASEERALQRLRGAGSGAASGAGSGADSGADELDEFMSSLAQHGQSMAHKADISRTKMGIQKLKTELMRTQRLADAARPNSLPPPPQTHTHLVKLGNNSVVYGKRIKLKEDAEKRPKIRQEKKQDEEEFVEEVDSDEEINQNKEVQKPSSNTNTEIAKDISVNENSKDKISEEGSRIAKNAEDAKDNEQETEETTKRVFGPMRPPDDYVTPENYFEQETDRDMPEIVKDD